MLILLAAYVSLGRQFMPAVAGYGGFLEQLIRDNFDVPVSIRSLDGGLQGFNPVLDINGLDIGVQNQQRALFFEQATVVVDVPASIWQRRWVLADFTIKQLEIDIEETEAGRWQLQGVGMPNASAGTDPVSLDDIYNIFGRFSDINLTNMAIKLHLMNGEIASFSNGLASIQNRDNAHYIHINFNSEDAREQLAFSLELSGQQLADIDGMVHFTLPNDDYSTLIKDRAIGTAQLTRFSGGGDFWLTLNDGSFSRFVSDLRIDELGFTVPDSAPTLLHDLSGRAALSRSEADDSWRLSVADFTVQWGEEVWESFNATANFTQEQSADVYADNVNVSFLAALGSESGIVGGAPGEQLKAFNPQGSLDNLSLHWRREGDARNDINFRTNLRGLQVDAVAGSPAMLGVNGYAEISYDLLNQQISGHAEVESDDFSINIPNVFVDYWDYSYVNASLDLQADLLEGQEIRLASNTIVLESDAVDARGEFSLLLRDRPGQQRESEISLLVGGLRIDGAQKHLYLPSSPQISSSLKNTMDWLNGAIIDGDVYHSGVIYRGSTLKGAAAAAKTFQSFYFVDRGQVNFSDEWPDLEQLSALVVTSDNDVDVEVLKGRSLGLDMQSALGVIRRDESGANWINISGAATGTTAQGLNYVQNAPLGAGLKNSLATWQAQGNFDARVAVDIPLQAGTGNTDVRLELSLDNNSLFMADYQLQANKLSGPVVFDTRTGIEATSLQAELFGASVALELGSQLGPALAGENPAMTAITVDANGRTNPAELAKWPLQSEFVNTLLSAMEGEFAYSASLLLPQSIAAISSESEAASDSPQTLLGGSELRINTDLLGTQLAFPEPFAKTAQRSMPLELSVTFSGQEQQVRGMLGDDLSFDIGLSGGEVSDGVVFLGDSATSLQDLSFNETPGLAILGGMEKLVFEEWLAAISLFSTGNAGSGGMSQQIGFVDLTVDVLEMYEQEFPAVNLRIEGDSGSESWLMGIRSDTLQGDVAIPFDLTRAIALDLDYLHIAPEPEEIPIEETSTEQAQELVTAELPRNESTEPEEPRVDVLADIDPRAMPAMDISVGEFTIGSNDYGRWKFQYRPTDFGASVEELEFEFRGLTAETEETEEGEVLQPGFRWYFDGLQHRSEFVGQLRAGDIADVLTANGFAPSLESDRARFLASVDWPGSPAFFAASGLSGELIIDIDDGRFLQDSGSPGALRLISILNFDALMRRLRFSGDLLRRGLSYDDINGIVKLEDGVVAIQDQLVIGGPSSVYQISGLVDLGAETIDGEMLVTLPLTDNIPWIGLLTANLPLAVGAFLVDQIFGEQFDSLTSAVYTLEGPWDTLEPEFKQAFGSPQSAAEATTAAPVNPQ